MPAYIGNQEIDTGRIPEDFDQFSILATFIWPEGNAPETHSPSLVIDDDVVYTQTESGEWWNCGRIQELSSGRWQAWHLMIGYGSRPKSNQGIHGTEIEAAWATI